MKQDRARIQLGKISRFGLLELSRQRLRPSISESTNIVCPRCNGMGVIRSVESLALAVLRLIGEEARKDRTAKVIAQLPVDVATYLMNEKRDWLHDIEQRSRVDIILVPNKYLETPAYELRRVRDDETDLPENSVISHQMAVEPKIDLEAIATAEEEKAPPPQQPAVTTIVPSTPAPPPAPEVPWLRRSRWRRRRWSRSTGLRAARQRAGADVALDRRRQACAGTGARQGCATRGPAATASAIATVVPTVTDAAAVAVVTAIATAAPVVTIVTVVVTHAAMSVARATTRAVTRPRVVAATSSRSASPQQQSAAASNSSRSVAMSRVAAVVTKARVAVATGSSRVAAMVVTSSRPASSSSSARRVNRASP